MAADRTLVFPAGTGSAGNVLVTDGAGNLSWSTSGDVLNGGNTVSSTMSIGTNSNHNLELKTNNATRVTISNTGRVGIGNSNPSSAVDVTGAIISRSHSQSTGAIDFNLANAITTTFDCSSNITLENIRDGGSYTLVITSTNTNQCNFSTSVTGADAATVSYRFAPSNGSRIANSHTVYSLQRIGNTIYVSWITGF
jgi:hypothetical protein